MAAAKLTVPATAVYGLAPRWTVEPYLGVVIWTDVALEAAAPATSAVASTTAATRGSSSALDVLRIDSLLDDAP